MPTLAQLNEQLEAKAKQLHDIFEKSKTESGEFDLSVDQITEVRSRQTELEVLGKSRDELRTAQHASSQAAEYLKQFITPANELPHAGGGANGGGNTERKKVVTAADAFIESAGYKGWRPGTSCNADVKELTLASAMRAAEMKTVMQENLATGAGYPPFVPRSGLVVFTPQRRPVVAELIPQDETTLSAIKWMQESVFTNAADGVAEGGTYPESALEYQEVTTPMEKIGTYIPVTDEQIADVPSLRGIIDNRLMLMLRLKEELELLSGTGSSPHIAGFLTASGVQNQNKGTDPMVDAVYKALTLVRWTAFADPSGIVMHPNDWQSIRLLRTADGLYIFGMPSEAGPERLWGLPVIQTPAITQGLALTGDFQMFSHISRRQGLTIDVTNSHSDNFVKDIQVIKITERLSLEIYRGSAFCTVNFNA